MLNHLLCTVTHIFVRCFSEQQFFLHMGHLCPDLVHDLEGEDQLLCTAEEGPHLHPCTLLLLLKRGRDNIEGAQTVEKQKPYFRRGALQNGQRLMEALLCILDQSFLRGETNKVSWSAIRKETSAVVRLRKTTQPVGRG